MPWRVFSKSPYKNTPGGEEIEDARLKDLVAPSALGATQPLCVFGGSSFRGFKLREGHVKGLNYLNCSNTMI